MNRTAGIGGPAVPRLGVSRATQKSHAGERLAYVPELDGLRGLDDLDELYAALEASRAQILASLERSERGIGFGKLRTALQAAGGQVRRTQATVKRIFGSSG